jgi:flagellar hook protein FlgE
VEVTWDAVRQRYDIKFTNNMAAMDWPNIEVAGYSAGFDGGDASVVAIVEGQEPTVVIPRNEIQTLNLNPEIDPTKTFTLSYGGVPTLAIPSNADKDAILAQLNTIPALKDNVTVTEARDQDGNIIPRKYNIEFIKALAGTNVDQLGFNSADGCNVTVLTSTEGRAAGYPEDAVSGSRDVYDSQGNVVTVYYRFFKYEIEPGSYPNDPTVTQPVTRWACDLSTDPLFENQEDYDANADFGAADLANPGTVIGNGDSVFRVYNIPFDEKGNITDPNLAKFTYSINRQVPPPGAGTANISCTIDLAGLTQRAGDSSAWASSQNGYAEGNLTSYSVGSDGTITGVYDNGERRDLARVAIANFENPSGLEQMGGTLFAKSNNSGDADFGAPMSGGRGKIIPSSLEMSNVDLSEEFTDMIITQRGFQANSRIITTSDEMLQELVNLKR